MNETIKVFDSLLPKKVSNYLDIGTRSPENWKIKRVDAERKLYNEPDSTVIKDMLIPCLFGDIREFIVFLKPKFFDLITCIDVIEHLKKEDGEYVISELESLCCGRLIFFTAIGEWYLGGDKRKWATHLSGWTPEEFCAKGYNCLVFPHVHGDQGAFYAVKDFKSPIEMELFETDVVIYKDNYWIER